MQLLVKLLESLVYTIIGAMIIILRKNILKIAMDHASKNAIDFPSIQQKMLLIIIWTIGTITIFGSLFKLLKTLFKF